MWKEGDVCHMCRVKFSLTTRQVRRCVVPVDKYFGDLLLLQPGVCLVQHEHFNSLGVAVFNLRILISPRIINKIEKCEKLIMRYVSVLCWSSALLLSC